MVCLSKFQRASFKLTIVAKVSALIGCGMFPTARLHAGGEKTPENPPKTNAVSDFSDPIKSYRSFLEAIKRDDVNAAKACYTILDNNKTGSLDVLVGMWVTFHRFYKTARLHFKEDVRKSEGEESVEARSYLRADCTDEALDRTISRLAGSKFKNNGDRAQLWIKWEKNDGNAETAFFCADNPLDFRKIEGGWKFDIQTDTTKEEIAALLAPGSWGAAFKGQMDLLNGVITDIESGKFKTWREVVEDLDQKSKQFEKKWTEEAEAVKRNARMAEPSPKK